MQKASLYLLIVCYCLPGKVCGQTAVTDSSFYRDAIDHIVHLYMDSVKENLRLYSGIEFTGGYRSSAGHPFFENVEPQRGTIFYSDVRYPDVLLKYDLTKDEVIFINPNNNLNIKLITKKIEGFTINDHLFVHIPEATGTHFPGEGFYELLYDSGSQVLVKRKKILRESAKAEELAKFNQSIIYYVKKESAWYKIESKKSLLAACRDHKAAVARFIQQERLNFKNDPGATIVKVMHYYSQLKK